MKYSRFGTVYRITCLIDGRVYIGCTTDYPSERWAAHQRNARRGKTSLLNQAIRQHGSENFLLEPIASALSSEALPWLEWLLIQTHKSYGPRGYNQTDGGYVGYSRTFSDAGVERKRIAANRPENVEANRIRNVERMRTEEGRQHQERMVAAASSAAAQAKLAQARQAYAQSDQGKNQLRSASMLGGLARSRPVIVEGRRFVSAREAARQLGLSPGVVTGRVKSRHHPEWIFE